MNMKKLLPLITLFALLLVGCESESRVDKLKINCTNLRSLSTDSADRLKYAQQIILLAGQTIGEYADAAAFDFCGEFTKY